MAGSDRVAVLHLITRDARRGAESAALALHEALVRRGWSSRIAALQPGPAGASLGVPVLGRKPLVPGTLVRLRKAGRSVDLVVAHGSRTLPACAVALAGSSPFVYVNIGDPRAWQTSAARRWRSRRFLARSRAVVAITQRSADSMNELLGVPVARITVIPNFRSSSRFHPITKMESRAVRAAHGVPDDVPLVVFLGSLSREKRPDLAIDAVSRLPGVHLVVAGTGALAADVARRAAGSESSDRIHVVGSVARPAELLAAADALILSSETEGVPGVLIEAGLCGTAAAAMSVGFVDEMLIDGVTGRLAPVGNVSALAAALADVLAGSERLGAAARALCLERFEEELVVDRWEHFLASVPLGRA